MGKRNKAEELHKRNYKRVRRFSELLDLPPEAVTDLPRLSMLGRGELLIENSKGIIEYTCARIRAQTSAGVIRVTGNELELAQLGSDRMFIRGDISAVEYI